MITDFECLIDVKFGFVFIQVIEFVVLKSENAYHIPNYRCRGRPCKTNLPSNTAFRGFGFPEVSVVVEAYITAVASQCNLLPEEVGNQSESSYKTLPSMVQIYIEHLHTALH